MQESLRRILGRFAHAAALAAALGSAVGCTSPAESTPERPSEEREAIGQRPDAPLWKAPANVGEWPMGRGGYRTCDRCDLDGLDIVVPDSVDEVVIQSSSAAGTKFHGRLAAPKWHFFYDSAPGATLDGLADVETIGTDFHGAVTTVTANILSSRDTDWSGFQGSLAFHDEARGVKFTGSSGVTISMMGTTVVDARFDGMRDSTVDLAAVRVSGTTRFDGSTGLRVRVAGSIFDGGAIVTRGANGSVTFAPAPTQLVGVDLSDAAGHALQLDGGGNVMLLPGSAPTKLPVGATHFIADADLRAFDLTGVRLVATPGETWPAVAAGETLDLSHLKLGHGGFPDGADLSHVKLDGASLERIGFANVKLAHGGAHASFRGANLSRADLGQQNIDGIDFTNADLRGARLDEVTGAADFTNVRAGVLAPGVDDNDTKLPLVTSFARAALSTSTFAGAYLEGADFGFADLAEVDLTKTTLDFARFTNARFRRNAVVNTTAKEIASARATLWDGADMRGLDLSNVDFRSLTGQRSSFASTLLCNATLVGAKLSDADLGGVFFDVDGLVNLPDGTSVPCTAGNRAGATTQTFDAALGTRCPNGGHAPLGADGQCTDAQWRVAGIPDQQCSDDEKRHPLTDGGSCTKHCQCQSTLCGSDGTCQEPS